MKIRFRLVKALLMNLPVSLCMSVVAQLVNILKGHQDHFAWGGMAVSFCFSYAAACLIALILPMDRWGMAFADRCGAQRGTFVFDVLVNLIVNTIFCCIMTPLMHAFSACLLRGLPLSSIPGGFAEMIGPVWISCFLVSLLVQKPALKAARRICAEGGMQ